MKIVLVIIVTIFFFVAIAIEQNFSVKSAQKSIDSLRVANRENEKLLECYRVVVDGDTANTVIFAKVMKCYLAK